jgi:hypothetical protein
MQPEEPNAHLHNFLRQRRVEIIQMPKGRWMIIMPNGAIETFERLSDAYRFAVSHLGLRGGGLAAAQSE